MARADDVDDSVVPRSLELRRQLLVADADLQSSRQLWIETGRTKTLFNPDGSCYLLIYLRWYDRVVHGLHVGLRREVSDLRRGSGSASEGPQPGHGSGGFLD